MKHPHESYHALVDFSTNVILVMGNTIAGLNFLNECTPNTYVAPYVNDPNYKGSFFWMLSLSSIKRDDYSKWTWDRKSRIFVKTKESILTDQLKDKSQLAVSKYLVINKIIIDISNARNKIATGVRFQEEIVYLEKKMQAKAFKATGYNEELIMEYPYVMQYADFLNISSKQATEDIIFKAKLDDQILIKTELLRLKYFNKVREATIPEQLSRILGEFTSDNRHIV